MPVADFYYDFALANFGAAVADAAGKLLAKMDGLAMPQASDWKNGPGNLVPNAEPWEKVQPRYALVDEMAGLRPRVKGAGNLERFDYWLTTWRAATAMAKACCIRGELDRLISEKKYPEALTCRIELAKVWSKVLGLQSEIVSTPGELGTIANLEQHTRKESRFLDAHDAALTNAVGMALPPEAEPCRDYTGPSRLIVPTVRTVAGKREAISLRIIALDNQPVKGVSVKVRVLGEREWRTVEAEHRGRAVWNATLPAATQDFEYCVEATTAQAGGLRWPVTAPELNQTVVVE
jgi:hypothetical protein